MIVGLSKMKPFDPFWDNDLLLNTSLISVDQRSVTEEDLVGKGLQRFAFFYLVISNVEFKFTFFFAAFYDFWRVQLAFFYSVFVSFPINSFH